MKKLIQLVLVLFALTDLSGQKASVREELILFPTYPFSDPDPVARPGKIYPYFRFDGYSLSPVEKKHKMVVLENDWIKVWIAPDMGGKVWGALDKKSNRYFIYYNNVVKFREIAMRGPWTSGGIEFNFGSIGHAPTTATPVDYVVRENGDGSVSCFLGATELTSRTEWQVEVMLPPDKAWFEIRSAWNNPTNQKTSLYHWQTAAADATDDLQYFFPGTAYIDHSGNAYEWPLMSDGRDISLYADNNYGSYHSYHVLGEYADWFAGYYHKSGYGFGHWVRYPYKPGKKIWIWGLSRQGEIWKGLLTDSARGNKQYTEIQTGLLFNQEADESTLSPFKHLYLMPGMVEYFRERWFPVGNTGGVVSVSGEGILNLVEIKDGFKLIFQSLGYINDVLAVTDTSGNTLIEIPFRLKPEEILEKDINQVSGDFIVRMKNGELFYRAGKGEDSKLERPLEMQPGFDWESVYGLYTRAVEKSKQRLYSEARMFFDKCLGKDPDYLPAYTGLAEIDFREMKYTEAERKLMKVLSFDTYDPDANYLYGNILMLKKEYAKARDAYGITLRSPGFRSSALFRLALISLREKRLEEAREYVNDGGIFFGTDLNITRLAAVIARLRDDNATYRLLMQRISSLDPLSHFVDFEEYLATGDTVSLKSFRSGFNTELVHEAYIELALWYFNAGQVKEALSVMELAPQDPVADLLTAYIASVSNDEKSSEFYLERALGADDKLVFPFRDEYAEVLKWADSKKPHWKTKYYSALLYWSKNQPETAVKYFGECGNLPISYSFYLSRGSFLKQTGGDEEAEYLKALKCGSHEWRPYHVLHGYYMMRNDYSKALAISREAMKIFTGSYIIRTDHALSLINTGSYSECTKLLQNTEIIPYEGAGYGRTIWRQANLLEAIKLINSGKINEGKSKIASARLWPENLGVGKPYSVDETFEDLLDAVCNIKTGKNAEKGKILSLISKLPPRKAGQPWSPDPEKNIIEGTYKLLDSVGFKY